MLVLVVIFWVFEVVLDVFVVVGFDFFVLSVIKEWLFFVGTLGGIDGFVDKVVCISAWVDTSFKVVVNIELNFVVFVIFVNVDNFVENVIIEDFEMVEEIAYNGVEVIRFVFNFDVSIVIEFVFGAVVLVTLEMDTVFVEDNKIVTFDLIVVLKRLVFVVDFWAVVAFKKVNFFVI
jgi:hypothetical protein